MRQERERRFFDLKRRQNGWFSCEGNLDPEGGTLLETALGAIAGEQKCEGDHRSPGQARADALSGLAEHRLAFGDLPEKGQEKPHLTIVVSAETLRGDEHSPAPQIDWGTPVSGETAKRDRLRRHRAYRGGRGPWGRDRGRSAHGARLPDHDGGAAQGARAPGRGLHLVRQASEILYPPSLGGVE